MCLLLELRPQCLYNLTESNSQMHIEKLMCICLWKLCCWGCCNLWKCQHQLNKHHKMLQDLNIWRMHHRQDIPSHLLHQMFLDSCIYWMHSRRFWIYLFQQKLNAMLLHLRKHMFWQCWDLEESTRPNQLNNSRKHMPRFPILLKRMKNLTSQVFVDDKLIMFLPCYIEHRQKQNMLIPKMDSKWSQSSLTCLRMIPL